MRLVSQAAKYAFAGAGLSAGHSIWRGLQKNAPLVLILLVLFGAFYLPYLGAKNLVQGYGGRGFFGTFFKTIVGNLLVLAIGFILLFFVVATFLSTGETNGTAASDEAYLMYLSYTFAPLMLLGLAVGVAQRKGRLRRFQIERENEAFLKDVGFKETGAEDITHYDADDTPLRMLEIQKDRISFMVVGARGKRAFIHMDDDGRFTRYAPAT